MSAEEQKVETAKIEEKPQAKPTIEKQTNCLACGKPIRKLKRYYRDGKFYCSKKCWIKKFKTKQEKE